MISTPADGQGASQRPERQTSASVFNIDTLLASPGPRWTGAVSPHFRLYVERSPRSPVYAVAMRDTLERAWGAVIDLLHVPVADTSPITVFITASRTRFPRLLPADAKGFTISTPTIGDLVILVDNDSVRMKVRHEIMHVVVRRAWGSSSPFAGWVNEGLAGYADGRCQATSMIAAGRDILHRFPELTVRDVADPSMAMFTRDRANAYVLSAALVAFVWETRGRDAIRDLWQAKDPDAALRQLGVMGDSVGDATRRWREWVAQRAGRDPQVDTAVFRRNDCG
jgi:hypothetical protein